MKLEGQASDGDLLRLMIAGDEGAFTTLYRRWQGAIYRFALQMTGNRGLAEEITQETFMTLIREAQSFNPARGTVPAFLYGICRNHILRSLGAEHAYVGLEQKPSNGRAPLAEPEAALDLLGDALTAETVARVRAAVLALPSNYREVVVLCDLHEMTYQQAAGVLECAAGTVRSRLHRARELLHLKLARSESGRLERALRQAQGSEPR